MSSGYPVEQSPTPHHTHSASNGNQYVSLASMQATSPTSEQPPNSANIQERKVFVGGLSWETTDEKLRIYFQNFGPVEDSVVIRDKQSGRPRGFGFVVFENPAHASKVVSIHKHMIDRREVETRLAIPKDSAELQERANGVGLGSGSAQLRKLFVGGLAPTVSERIFRQYFLQYGPIEDIVVMYDHTSGRPRGFGFVTFKHDESLQRVFSQQVHAIHEKQIDVKQAISREQMPQVNYEASYPNGRSRLPVTAGARGFAEYGGNMAGIQDMVNIYGLGNELDYMNTGLAGMGGGYGGNGNPAMLSGLQGIGPMGQQQQQQQQQQQGGGLEGVYGGGMGGFAGQFGGHFGGQYDQYIPSIEDQQLLGQNVGADAQLINSQLNGLDQLGLRMQHTEGADVAELQQFQDAQQHARNESQASVDIGVLDTFTSALSAQLDQIPLQSTAQGNSLANLSHQVNSLLGEENVH